jgi:hypothetical protein
VVFPDVSNPRFQDVDGHKTQNQPPFHRPRKSERPPFPELLQEIELLEPLASDDNLTLQSVRFDSTVAGRQGSDRIGVKMSACSGHYGERNEDEGSEDGEHQPLFGKDGSKLEITHDENAAKSSHSKAYAF